MTAWQTLKEEGNAAFKAGSYPEAVRCFSEAIKLSPSDHVLYSNRSGAYAAQQKFKEALADADQCIKLKPDWPKGYSRKGLAHFQLGEYAAAATAYEKALQLDPNNAQFKEGIRQAMEKDPELMKAKQLALLVKSLRRDPKFAKYFEEDAEYEQRLTGILGEILKDPTQNLQLAMSMCPDQRIKEGLIKLLHLPTPEESVDEDELKERQRAKERERQAEAEKKAQAAKEAQRVKSVEELEAEKMKEEGNKLYKERKFEEALAKYDHAFEKYPKEISYLTNKAAVYMEMGDLDKAIQECEKVLEMRYDMRVSYEKVAKVYCRLAHCYQKKGDLGKVIEMYEKALVENNDRHTRAALADAKRMKDKLDKEAYINPELAEKHVVKGNELFRAGQYPEAKLEYDEAARRDPSSARVYSNRAAVLMKLLDLPGALKDADKSLELDANNAKVWARKGNIHSLMKEYQKALEAYQKGLNVDANNADCQMGMHQVTMKVQQSMSGGPVDEEQVKRAMMDPEIQAILADPQMNIILQQLQTDPTKFSEVRKDAEIAAKLQKLVLAGILRVA